MQVFNKLKGPIANNFINSVLVILSIDYVEYK